MTKKGERRLVIFLCAAAVILVAAGIVRAKLHPPRPLHEQIADYMYHSRTDPKLEYLIEKYGDEFIATEYGSIQSTRFPGLQVHLEWSEQDQTYKDTYIVYIRQAELEDLLSTALNDIYSQYKIYILPYGLCPNDYNENTTAIELLKCSDTALPLVQLWIYTTDEVNDRDISCEMLQRKMQELGYFFREKFYRFSDYLGTTSQMSELLGISSISGILRFGRYPAYHGISEPHLAVKSSKTVVETAAYYYAASLSIAAFAEA